MDIKPTFKPGAGVKLSRPVVEFILPSARANINGEWGILENQLIEMPLDYAPDESIRVHIERMEKEKGFRYVRCKDFPSAPTDVGTYAERNFARYKNLEKWLESRKSYDEQRIDNIRKRESETDSERGPSESTTRARPKAGQVQ